MSDLVDKDPQTGYIVVSTGKVLSYSVGGKKIKVKMQLLLMNQFLKLNIQVKIIKKCFWCYIQEDESNVREYSSGSLVTVFKKSLNDRRLIVNGSGEGGIWVCNENGNLNSGDFITTLMRRA